MIVDAGDAGILKLHTTIEMKAQGLSSIHGQLDTTPASHNAPDSCILRYNNKKQSNSAYLCVNCLLNRK
jgi:hypothetical protein